MMSYNTYLPLPSVRPEATGSCSVEAPPQAGYHLKVVHAKRQGLIANENMFKKKYEKYTKILN